TLKVVRRGRASDGMQPPPSTATLPRMKFTTVLEGANTAGIPVPDEVLAALDAGKRPKVVVTIGNHTYRSSIMPYKGKNMISLSADNRVKAGVEPGEGVGVGVEVAPAPRVVAGPADMTAAPAAADGAAAASDDVI